MAATEINTRITAFVIVAVNDDRSRQAGFTSGVVFQSVRLETGARRPPMSYSILFIRKLNACRTTSSLTYQINS
ncbi:unnamed protein product [Linum tenue]|uniref:Uncharacterized protein n=1 Tax=Linum tenue TaxID=586396 RepID=A0AAV0GQ99_9ROSI|nr:unnamed protein product [Linum tenue]